MTGSRGILALGALATFSFVSPSARANDFDWPVSGRVADNYYSPRPYGYHSAIDIAGPSGDAVGAARAGTVSFRGYDGGYGNLVIVNHEAGYSTYYAHNTSFGQGGNVGRMTTISYRGSTGNSTGPHVHFEIRRYGVKLFIPASIGSYLTKGAGVPQGYAGLAGTAAPDPVVLNPDPYALNRIVCGRNADGRPQFFFLNSNNEIKYRYWTGGGWAGGSFGGWAKDLSLVSGPDGRMELFYIGTNDAIYHRWQAVPNGGWTGETRFGGMAKSLSAVRWGDGHIELFYAGTNNHIYHRWWDGRGWTGEVELGGLASSIVAAANADGRAQVFYVGTNGGIYTRYWTTGGWSGEVSMGGQARQIAVNMWGDGHLEMFYVGLSTGLFHNWQVRPNGSWSGEASFPGQAKKVALGRWGDGRLEPVYIGTNNAIYHNWWGGRWTGEAPMGGEARDLTVGTWPHGGIELFYVGANNWYAYHRWWTGRGWSGEGIF